LPGITNGTSRIRCYSFYPWFVRAFEQETKKKTVNEFVRTFRRAECLHTLIGIFHELETGEATPHGRSLAGRLKLVPAAREVFGGRTMRLSDYANRDAEEAQWYFRNPIGGLGQYYLGPLKDLAVLDGDALSGVKYTDEWGKRLAELHGEGVDKDLFLQTIRGDRVNADTLEALRSFCPCRLQHNDAEREALVDLMFCRNDEGSRQQLGGPRRDTLLLLLDYAARLDGSDQGVDLQSFLSSSYRGVLPTGTRWQPSSELMPSLAAWSVYQKHELLSLAVQGLFWAGLSALRDEQKSYTDSPASYARWFATRFESALSRGERTMRMPAIVSRRAASLPPHDDHDAEGHELMLAEELMAATAEGDIDRGSKAAIGVLLALLGRGKSEPAYGRASVTSRFFQTYEINLDSLQRLASGTWCQLTGREWMEQLGANWGLRVHFRVALRKLRHQTQDSFRIVPRDDGLHVRDAPAPQWSAPRLAQALTFLSDLGALDIEQEEGVDHYVVTPYGRNLLEDNIAAE
jgi:hypothetical protein